MKKLLMIGMIMELTREINLPDSKSSFYLYAKERARC